MNESFQIAPPHRALLESAGLADLRAWLRLGRRIAGGGDPGIPGWGPQSQKVAIGGPCPCCRVVSRHPDRVTISLELPDPGGCPAGQPIRLFAKIQFSTPVKQTALSLLRGRRPISNPVNEWNWLTRLAGLGIDAMAPVAAGEWRPFGLPATAVLVVLAVPAPCDLERCLIEQPELADDPTLWSALGRLIGRLEAGGISWPDMICRHLFPQRSDAGWRIFLIDVERMSPGRGPRSARALWSALAASLPRRPSSSSADAMLAAYRPPGQLRDASSILSSLSDRPALPPGYWLAGHPKMVREGQVVFNQAYRAALAEAGLDDFDAIFGFAGGQSLAKPGLPGRRRRDRIVLGGRVIYLKRYQAGLGQRVLRSIRRALRPSEAADEWHALWRLANGGVAVPEPVLFGQSCWRGGAARSCIALAGLPAAESLEKWLPAHGPELSPDRRRELFDRLAGFVGQFHSLGTVHRDLYLSHIFVSVGKTEDRRQETEDRTQNAELKDEQHGDTASSIPSSEFRVPSSEWTFYLIDLARVFRPTRLRRARWIIKDLAALRYSLGTMIQPEEWSAFLRRYRSGRRLDAAADSGFRDPSAPAPNPELGTQNSEINGNGPAAPLDSVPRSEFPVPGSQPPARWVRAIERKSRSIAARAARKAARRARQERV